jgi:two-component system sensor histidine kinase BaeS
MADVAHELRTPLAVLRADLEAVQDGVRSASGESLNSLLAEVRTLNKLIDDLHDLSLADVGALSYRKAVLGVDELLQRCIAPFRERFAHKQLRLVTAPTDPELRVFADGSRLQQLLNNLLENSLRYTDAPGETRVSGARDGGEVLMSIDDSAPGVPPELLPRLFERFFRVDSSRNRETGGSGLGLAICRSIVEAHGGSIAAARSMLGGLRIDIRLPLAP